MFRKTWIALGVITLSLLGVFMPATALAQHGPGGHGSDSRPAYDTQSETTVNGTVEDVNNGRSAWRWLSRIHTLGLVRTAVPEKQLLLNTETGTIQIHLGPAAFLTEKHVEIRKGDTLKVTGSRVTIGDSQVVLAREMRKGDDMWMIRDAAGQPLWSSGSTEARGFWTTKKVLLVVVATKVVLLATVLRH